MRIVILGGGTAGWMAAAALSRVLGKRTHSITLIESSSIPTVGVGEATIPVIDQLHRIIGITPFDLVKHTDATFKLGIDFVDWARKDHSYFHPFGFLGNDMNGISFVHYWLRQRALGNETDLGEYSIEISAARAGKFNFEPPRNATDLRLNHAYHFDAGLYAQLLRQVAERAGVTRIDAKMQSTQTNAETGNVEALVLESGRAVEGDLFIDCSGFRALLIGQELGNDFVDWKHYLPCDTAITAQTEVHTPLPPFTRSTARDAGWQWRIPLQTRTGNGYVHASEFTDPQQAMDDFVNGLDRPLIGDPRTLKFKTGYRPKMWDRNVIALGLSAGFLEPLESTAIHLVQSAITKLMLLFPRGDVTARARDSFNTAMTTEYERIRDFLLAHYAVTARDDTPFWRYFKSVDLPDSYLEYLEFYHEDGIFLERTHDLFKERSWFAVLHGQGLTPKRYHPVADAPDEASLNNQLAMLRQRVAAKLSALPTHDEFVAACRDMGARP